MFVYRVRKYLGAYSAALGGAVDAVVFSAGIGENSALVRGAVCADLEVGGWVGGGGGEGYGRRDGERERRAAGRRAGVWGQESKGSVTRFRCNVWCDVCTGGDGLVDQRDHIQLWDPYPAVLL
jgi:hypothetical protein